MRTWQEATAYAEAEHAKPSRDWTNLCQMFTRSCLGAAAWAPSAREAFNAVPVANRHTSVPPEGAGVYYGNAHSGAGHATYSAGGGYVWSTDILRHGKVDRVRYDVFEHAWGLPFRGWIDLTPSGPVSLRPPVVAPVVKAGAVVHVGDLVGIKRSPSAAYINRALIAEGYKIPTRAYWSPATSQAFRNYRNVHGFGKNTRAALLVLGAKHGFTVA